MKGSFYNLRIRKRVGDGYTTSEFFIEEFHDLIQKFPDWELIVDINGNSIGCVEYDRVILVENLREFSRVHLDYKFILECMGGFGDVERIYGLHGRIERVRGHIVWEKKDID